MIQSSWLTRTEILLGHERTSKIQKSKVSIVGLGGVGAAATEALARAGVGNLQIIDFDSISLSNINRQTIAFHSTLGKKKTEVMKSKILDINPLAKVDSISEFFQKKNRLQALGKTEFVIDAIDSIGPKMGLIKDLCELNIPFISVLGAGNRLDFEKVKLASIWETEGCPFAKRLKKLLRRNNITKDIKVIYSCEDPITPVSASVNEGHKDFSAIPIPKSIVGSISYLPPIMGQMAAGYIIRLIIAKE